MKRLTAEEADALHARSCSCGDRLACEAENGCDWTLDDSDEAAFQEAVAEVLAIADEADKASETAFPPVPWIALAANLRQAVAAASAPRDADRLVAEHAARVRERD